MSMDDNVPFGMATDNWPGLAKLSEECGELVQVLAKLMQTGGDRQHWDGDLVPRLVEEIGDVQAAIWFFTEHNPQLEYGAILSRTNVKHALFNRWRNGLSG